MLMRRLIWWLSYVFFPEGFSDFAYLGDLSKYHLKEMQSKLNGSWKEEITLYSSYQLVKWSNRHSICIIYYTLAGDFIQIKEEVWKKENEIFIRPLRKDYEFK